jgi:hypothetical protein
MFLAVQPEAGVGLELRLADAERHGLAVADLAVGAGHPDGGLVEVRAGQVPQAGRGQVDLGAQGLGAGDADRDRRDVPPGHDLAVRIGDDDLQPGLGVGRAAVGDVDLDLGDGPVLGDRRRADEGAALLDVQVAGLDQPDLSQDPRAGVPARRRRERGVGPHGQHVGAVGAQEVGDVVAQADIAAGAVAQVVAVDPDAAALHHPVQLDEHPAAGRRLDVQRPAVPGHARGQEAAGPAGPRLDVERPGDGPVVRDADGRPAGVVEGGGLGALGIALDEAPAVGQRRRDAVGGVSCRRQQGQGGVAASGGC